MDEKEKAIAYDKALEKAKDFNFQGYMDEECLYDMFPELRESEDEKVRKEIIDYCHERLNTTYGALPNIETVKKWLAWLEKQGKKEVANSENACKGEQEPKSYKDAEEASAEYRKFREECGIKDPVMLDEIEEAYYNGATSRKPVDWSDEDEENLQHCCMAISVDSLHTYEDKQDMESWLQSLKNRCIWKPTKEHVKAVRLARSFVTDDFGEHPMLSETLIDLEEQLKKLREE